MKRLFVPLIAIALVCTLLGACVTEDQPQPPPKHGSKSGFHTPTPTPSVTDGDSTPEPRKKKQDEEKPQTSDTKPPNPVPEGPVQQGDLPYAKAVPGKPGFVFSPSEQFKYIDVRGFPPGTEVKDPYSNKSFLVP